MYSDYNHATIADQRATYDGRPQKLDAWVIWLPGLGESGKRWSHLQVTCSLPWIKWSFPDEAMATLTLTPPLRFIRPEGIASNEPQGLASAVSAVHAMLAQAEAMGYPSQRIVLGGFGQGAALAVRAARTYPRPLAGIVMFSGWVPVAPCPSSEANASTPVLLCHGTNDGTVSHTLLKEVCEPDLQTPTRKSEL